jgi:membrane-associated protein
MFQFLQPQHLIEAVGLLGIVIVVFAESGLFFGFFLPGDSLLFTAGLFAAQGTFNIFWLVVLVALAAIAGDSVGYMFGKKVGPALFTREDSFFFHKKHAEHAKAFYQKYGKKTIILARFIPIVRTFAPIVAGIGDMAYKTFVSFNVIGGIAWTCILTLSGYFLGRVFPQIQHYLNYVIVFIIVISFIPIAVEWLKERRKRNVV